MSITDGLSPDVRITIIRGICQKCKNADASGTVGNEALCGKCAHNMEPCENHPERYGHPRKCPLAGNDCSCCKMCVQECANGR